MRMGILLVVAICVLGDSRDARAWTPYDLDVAGWGYESGDQYNATFTNTTAGVTAVFDNVPVSNSGCRSGGATPPVGSGGWTTAYVSDKSFVLCLEFYAASSQGGGQDRILLVQFVAAGSAIAFDPMPEDVKTAVFAFATALSDGVRRVMPSSYATPYTPPPEGTPSPEGTPPNPEKPKAPASDWDGVWDNRPKVRLSAAFVDTKIGATDQQLSGGGVDLDYVKENITGDSSGGEVHARADKLGDDMASTGDDLRLELWGGLGLWTSTKRRIRGFGNLGAGCDYVHGDAGILGYANLGGSIYITKLAHLDAYAMLTKRWGTTDANPNRFGARLAIWKIVVGVEAEKHGDLLSNQLSIGVELAPGRN